MRTRTVVGLAASLVLAACSSASPSVVPTPTPAPATPTAVASLATPTPTPAPTPAPPTPTATPSGPVAVTGQEILSWWYPNDNLSKAELVVEVTNTGSSWEHLLGQETTFNVRDADGNAVATSGAYRCAFPAYLAPGETGRFTEVATADGNVELFHSFDAALAYEEVDEADAVLLPTDNAVLAPSDGSGPYVNGTVSNSSTVTVAAYGVAAFFFDGDGNLLGYAVADVDDPLAPGASADFYSGRATPLLVDYDAIVTTFTVAAPRD